MNFTVDVTPIATAGSGLNMECTVHDVKFKLSNQIFMHYTVNKIDILLFLHISVNPVVLSL